MDQYSSTSTQLLNANNMIQMLQTNALVDKTMTTNCQQSLFLKGEQFSKCSSSLQTCKTDYAVLSNQHSTLNQELLTCSRGSQSNLDSWEQCGIKLLQCQFNLDFQNTQTKVCGDANATVALENTKLKANLSKLQEEFTTYKSECDKNATNVELGNKNLVDAVRIKEEMTYSIGESCAVRTAKGDTFTLNMTTSGMPSFYTTYTDTNQCGMPVKVHAQLNGIFQTCSENSNSSHQIYDCGVHNDTHIIYDHA